MSGARGGLWEVGYAPASGSVVGGRSGCGVVADSGAGGPAFPPRPNPSSPLEVFEGAGWREAFASADGLLFGVFRDALFDYGGTLEAVGGVGVAKVASERGALAYGEPDVAGLSDDARYLEAVAFVDRWGQVLRDCGVAALSAQAVEALVSRLRAYIAARPPLRELADSLASVLVQADRLCAGQAATITLPAAVAARTRPSWLGPMLVVLVVGVVLWGLA